MRYELVDLALVSLSSGQKILVRMGPANEARAKALIRELRSDVHQTAQQPPLQPFSVAGVAARWWPHACAARESAPWPAPRWRDPCAPEFFAR